MVECGVREAVRTGYEHSPIFRTLVDRIEAAAIVVYVESAASLGGTREGALLHMVAGSRTLPVLRVLLKRNLGRRQTIGILAHELQHVLEAAGAGDLTADGAMHDVFEALDRNPQAGAQSFETDAARAVGRRVQDELRRGRRGYF